MPLPGGTSAKVGLRYEALWTVRCVAEMLAERADAIRVEPPGQEGEGVEFWFRLPGSVEYHQVKRQNPKGHWTLAALISQGVLGHFKNKLGDPEARCVFVSAQDAPELHELGDHARRASSAEEFRSAFIRSEKQARWFDEICEAWDRCAGSQAYEWLKRIEVRPIGEEVLRSYAESLLSSHVEGDPATITDVLSQYLLVQVNTELTAQDLWRHLESRGFHRREWHKDPRVLAAVEETTGHYLRLARQSAIGDQVIPREEAGAMVAALTGADREWSVIAVGEAGTGKSGALLQVVEAVRDRGWPVIAFRVDRLVPTGLPDEVGRQLGLPGSPARVLGAVAHGRECLLVIDQLDAVSLVSGRASGFFDCLNEVIAQARAYPAMRLLLACRKFDLDNDPRLRRLTGEKGLAKEVAVGRLSRSSVEAAVRQLGLDPACLTSRQWDLLALPLHLSLVAEIVGAGDSDVFDLEAAQDLYDRFWSRKQDVLRERLGRPVRWTEGIDALSDYMSTHQVLSVPESILDEVETDAKAMASEHVLILDRGRYGFFHEGFFDYAFARRFVARGGNLVHLLGGAEQHLFRRAQMRQILLHERRENRSRYLADLKWLLTAPTVRFHLRAVVFALLADLRDPTPEEWEILERLTEVFPPRPRFVRRLETAALEVGVSMLRRWAPTATRLRGRLSSQLLREASVEHAWGVLCRSGAWFLLLNSLGVIERWLREPPDVRIDRTVTLLFRMQRGHADRVAELLEPYVGVVGSWPQRLRFVMQWADLGAGRRFLELFLRLIDDGTLDEIRGSIAVNSDFWSLVYPVTERQPGWACEIIAHYFARRLELSLAGGQANPFDSDRGTLQDAQLAGDIFLRAGRGAPQALVAEVLPFMLRVMDLTAERAAEPPWPDPAWRYRFFGGGYNLAEQLLVAMETALAALAQSAPEELRPILDRLLGVDFETAQYLAVRTYTASGERFADEAVDYILARPRSLEIGYLDSSRWAARQLIEAVTAHCSADRLVRVEEVLLAYYPRWERSVEGRRAHGHAQLVLLEGVAPARRSERVTRRIGELRRKFGADAIQAPTRGGFELIRPPIPEAASDKMSDDQWLSAIARYSQDRETFRGGHFTGGALELSRLLESQVKKEPRRFAALVSRFSDDTHSHYFDAVLQGIGDSELDVETVLAVCRRCHGLRGRPCGRWITRPIARLAASALPEEALEIVTWYATEDKDPEEETWRAQSPGGKPYYGGDILAAAINSVRGTATEALAELIFHDPARLAFFRSTLERLARDPSVSVRCCLASALTVVLRYDRDLAVRLFLMASDIDEDRLFATHYVERFLAYALRTHFRALLPVVERMRSSNVTEVATAGSRRLCAASLDIEDAIPLVRTCLNGSDQQRLGAAQVFAANLREAAFRSFSEGALITLFNDRSEEVRGEAAHCFRGLEVVGLAEYDNMVAKFAGSRAFANAPYHLIHALIEDTGPLPEATCFVCERFIEVFAGEARTIQTRAGGEAGRVSQLIVRVYSQSHDQVVQGRCLDLMDRMAAAEILGFDEAVVQYER